MPEMAERQKKKFEIYLESDEFLKRLEKNEFAGKIDAISISEPAPTRPRPIANSEKEHTEYRSARNWALANKVYFAYASARPFTAEATRISDGMH